MNQNSSLNQAYSDLSRLGRGEITAESHAQIKKALTGSKSLLVSKAADIAAAKDLQDLVPEMIKAFERLMEKGPDSDKGCRAKTSIVRALNKLEHIGASVFLAGARYVQMEGSFGPPEDTAVDVRSESAMGLARINHPDVHFILADLLVDKEMVVRIATIKAATYLGDPESELMLRLKALCGDKPEVLGECFLGLMTMSPKRSLDFIARYLRSPDPLVVEGAAIAAGNSHLPEALQLLMQTWETNPRSDVRRAILLPIALIRSDDAFEFLVQVLGESDVKTGIDALTALSLYAGDSYRAKVHNCVKKINNPSILGRYNELFGVNG